MTNQILSNLKSYINERQSEVMERYECSHSDYSSGKLDGLDEIINYITGEEIYFGIDGEDLYEV